MQVFIVVIPGPKEVYAEDIIEILNEGIPGAWHEPIKVDTIDSKWDEFNKENGWWDFGYLEYNFNNHYDGAEEFLKFLKVGDKEERS